MRRITALAGSLLLLGLIMPASAPALAIKDIARCQKKFAAAGARYAMQVIKTNLKCTTAISQCQIECELGAFGPPCDTNPPPCCDPDDVGSNGGFAACMNEAQEICDRMEEKKLIAEAVKQIKIIGACKNLTVEELCGGETPGLNYAILNAGCQAIIPGFTCDLLPLVNCVGGPLEEQLANQISALLDARAAEAIGVLGFESRFPGIPRGRKVKGNVAAGTVDLWAVDGIAGEEFSIKVINRRDGHDTSGLQPVLLLIDRDGRTGVADTSVVSAPCPVTSPCGSTCPQLTRRLPFTGTFYIGIGAGEEEGCPGGKYKLTVRSPRGAKPTLVADDIPPGTFTP
jgi:hypothetical protein